MRKKWQIPVQHRAMSGLVSLQFQWVVHCKQKKFIKHNLKVQVQMCTCLVNCTVFCAQNYERLLYTT